MKAVIRVKDAKKAAKDGKVTPLNVSLSTNVHMHTCHPSKLKLVCVCVCVSVCTHTRAVPKGMVEQCHAYM